jgi:hypothetical protein
MRAVLEGIKETFPTHNGRRPNRKVSMAQIEEIKATSPKRRASKSATPARRGRPATLRAAEA